MVDGTAVSIVDGSANGVTGVLLIEELVLGITFRTTEEDLSVSIGGIALEIE